MDDLEEEEGEEEAEAATPPAAPTERNLRMVCGRVGCTAGELAADGEMPDESETESESESDGFDDAAAAGASSSTSTPPGVCFHGVIT